MYKLTNYNGQTYVELPDGSLVYQGLLSLTIQGTLGSFTFLVFSRDRQLLYTITQQQVSDYFGNSGAPFLAMSARDLMQVFMDANLTVVV